MYELGTDIQIIFKIENKIKRVPLWIKPILEPIYCTTIQFKLKWKKN